MLGSRDTKTTSVDSSAWPSKTFDFLYSKYRPLPHRLLETVKLVRTLRLKVDRYDISNGKFESERLKFSKNEYINLEKSISSQKVSFHLFPLYWCPRAIAQNFREFISLNSSGGHYTSKLKKLKPTF